MTYVRTNNWMSVLDASLTLDKFSIPGTHDSGTAKAPPERKISLSDVLDDCLRFLSKNPSETIIMLMDAATSDTKGVQEKFNEYFAQAKYQSLFYLTPFCDVRSVLQLHKN